VVFAELVAPSRVFIGPDDREKSQNVTIEFTQRSMKLFRYLAKPKTNRITRWKTNKPAATQRMLVVGLSSPLSLSRKHS
jgi:hypothetical protein